MFCKLARVANRLPTNQLSESKRVAWGQHGTNTGIALGLQADFEQSFPDFMAFVRSHKMRWGGTIAEEMGVIYFQHWHEQGRVVRQAPSGWWDRYDACTVHAGMVKVLFGMTGMAWAW